jgi:hypothetical protein
MPGSSGKSIPMIPRTMKPTATPKRIASRTMVTKRAG